MYNLTNITNAGNFFEVVKNLDSVFPAKFGGAFGIGLMLVTFAVLFISLKSGGFEFKSCFASAMFVTVMVGFFSTAIGLLSFEQLLPAIVLLGVSVVMLFMGGD